MQKVQGTSGLGGRTVVVAGSSSTTTFQETYPGSTVTIYIAGTTTLATRYTDNGVTVGANPFTSSSVDGSWYAYLANGRYDVRFSGTGIGTPFTLGDISVYDTEDDALRPIFFQVTGLDQWAELQAILNRIGAADSGTPKTVQLSRGDLVLSRPIVQKTRLGITDGPVVLGDPAYGTRVFPEFGSGYAWNVMSTLLGFPTGTALVTGSDVSVRIGPGKPYMLMFTEPLANLSTLAQLDIRFFCKRVTTGDYGVYVDSNVNLKVVRYTGIRIAETTGAGLQVIWNGIPHTTADGLLSVGVRHLIELSYDGSNVRLFLDGIVVLSFAFTGNVPQKGNVEVLGIGVNPADASGQQEAVAPGDAWLGPIEFSNVARHTANYTPPTSAFVHDSNTLFGCNFLNTDLQENFVVWHSGVAGRDAWITVQNLSSDPLVGNCHVANLTFVGNAGASGLHVHNTINGTYRNLSFANTQVGPAFTGITFGTSVENIYGGGIFCGWLQVTQSEATSARGVNISSRGITFIAVGAIGGAYEGFLITPIGGFASMYLNGTGNVDFFNVQIDDEGQAPSVEACIIANGAIPKIHGGIITGSFSTPYIQCGGGGSVQLYGPMFLAFNNSVTELIHFTDPPAVPALVFNADLVNPSNAPWSLNPEYVVVVKDFKLCVPGVKIASSGVLEVGSTQVVRSQLPGVPYVSAPVPTDVASLIVAVEDLRAQVNKVVSRDKTHGLISGTTTRRNVALLSQSSVASVTSTASATVFPASTCINGSRVATTWGDSAVDGGWSAAGATPDTLTVQFPGVFQVDEIDVVTLQDNVQSSTAPTLVMTFSNYGAVDYTVDYRDLATGSWTNVATVIGNNKVWKQFTGLNVLTDAIRVVVTTGGGGIARLVEVEAWGN